MQQDIPKMCADSLRTFTKEKLNIKLKAAHAHELVASYFGYPSKNAMLADTEYSINSFQKAKIVIMAPDSYIDERRKNLQGLSAELPNSYMLGESVYAPLLSDEFWSSKYPPFRSFEKAAKYLATNNHSFQSVFQFYQDVPLHHLVSLKAEKRKVVLSVVHATKNTNGDMVGNGKTIIELQRIAGHIGFGEPQIHLEKWTGGARRNLELIKGTSDMYSWGGQ